MRLTDFLGIKNDKHEVYTIGYEGKDIGEFIETLKENRIKCLIDVRYTPLSRKPNFSKTALKKHLIENGINMISVPEVGAPKEFRDLLKGTKNYAEFFALYSNHIRKNRLFDKLKAHINGDRACIMCFEKDSDKCHRHVLSEMLEKEMEAKITHL